MSTGKKIEIALVGIFSLVLTLMLVQNIPVAETVKRHAFDFGLNIFQIIPCAFVLIGLFEVWVKKETVEKHFGHGSGVAGHFWGIVLASTTVGGLYVAFPVAAALYHKGARLAVIFSYVGASAIVRIPMTIFEASFVGVKFSILRLLISIPLVVLSAEVLGRYLQARGFELQE